MRSRRWLQPEESHTKSVAEQHETLGIMFPVKTGVLLSETLRFFQLSWRLQEEFSAQVKPQVVEPTEILKCHPWVHPLRPLWAHDVANLHHAPDMAVR